MPVSCARWLAMMPGYCSMQNSSRVKRLAWSAAKKVTILLTSSRSGFRSSPMAGGMRPRLALRSRSPISVRSAESYTAQQSAQLRRRAARHASSPCHRWGTTKISRPGRCVPRLSLQSLSSSVHARSRSSRCAWSVHTPAQRNPAHPSLHCATASNAWVRSHRRATSSRPGTS